MTTLAEAPPVRTGAGWLMLATTASGLVNYVYALLLTHGLTPAEYAAFAGGQALLLVRATISAAGIPWILARELAQPATDRALVTTFAFWANLALGSALTVVITAFVLTFGSPREATVIALASLIMSVGSTSMGFLQGTNRMGLMALLFAVEAALKASVGAILVFALHLGSTGALAGFVVGSLVLLAPWPLYRHLVGRPTIAHTSLLRGALRQTRLQGAVAVTAAGDTVLAALFGGASAYQAASALGRVPLFASNAVATAAFPRIGSALSKGAALRAYLLVGIFMTGAMITLPAALRSALFPATFAAVGRWLPYAAVLGLAIGLLNLCVSFLQATTGSSGLVVASAVVYLGLVALSGWAFSTAGLAVGSALFALLTVAALAFLPSVRPGWRALFGCRRNLRDLSFVLTLICVLGLATNPALWLTVVALGGLAVLALAFPEFAPRRVFAPR
ncbi:oligosaccharide flippase family protein [Winogradskya humida]|uniref:O-antigen/teichoic acid export membrane protein n=1 Tax=Winogradskya humida TaxID=113566 RepID=A0ABQ3ZVH1_9ACTN|nr:oligosaccharide flippase family protein [Actinoplanes humidus]GIE22600.1 hypothetical protein Ahu01nite_057020 [Actinoplanes humidus]